MRWQTLAFPCLMAAGIAACGPKPGTNGETGAVPGSTIDSTSMSTPPATPAPGMSDSTASPAMPADTGMNADSTSMQKP